jgi:uncharacterized protein YjiS (DUF1127 family)
MTNSFLFGRLIERRTRKQGYEAIRTELENLTDADLQDIGVKRYQLGHMARVKALS